MKVAIIGIKGLPSKGGAERVVEAVVRRIISKGVEPTIYCDAHYTPVDYSIDGVRLIRIPTIDGKHIRTLSLVLFAAIHAVLFARYDLVHLHNIEVAFVLPLLRIKYRVIGTAHGFAYWRSKWSNSTKRIMRTMDFLFVKYSNIVSSVSAKDARDLKKRFNKEVLYISNGVSTDFNPDYLQAQKILKNHGINENKYFIFIAGRIEPTKGAHLAIEAVNKFKRGIPLLIVGDDSQIESYRAKLHEMAGPHIYFQPIIENPSVLFGLMKQSTCLIFPSLKEAMSMVLLEAVSLGVPVICSDIEENIEVLGEGGIYFKSGDINSLVEKLQWLLENLKDINMNAVNLQQYIHREYSWDKITNQYLKLYKEAVCN